MAEKKEYRSAIRSRRMIRAAFLELLREKPFEKITVTDIVTRADINRSTFYAHYPDVQGMVDELIDETISGSVELVKNMAFEELFENPIPFLQALTNIGTKNVELYRPLGRSDFALKQTEKIKDILVEQAMNTIAIPESVRRSPIFLIHINFFLGGILNTYQQWLQGKLLCSTEEIVEQIGTLITANGETYRRLLEK